ncbi:hypothetical protein ACBJ59_61200 [Nonomuraea sp. MTCD27]|uniref:hypothetical protein n=1 Tax=Nonomuraea sp. MTCD27 TaxID=1676747 RepID=UPI0035C026BB
MNRPDLFALVGHRVTITRPGYADPVTGRLAAYAESPHLIVDLDDGQRWVLPQDRCKVTPADDAEPASGQDFRHIINRAVGVDAGDLFKDLEDTAHRIRQENLLNRLGNMLADLDGFVERRAAEVAAPHIAETGVAAGLEVQAARDAQQRAEDLTAELRRQLTSLERQIDRYRQENEQDKATIRRVRALTRLPECPAAYDDNVTECQSVVACSWEEAYWREAMAHVDAALAVPESAPPG